MHKIEISDHNRKIANKEDFVDKKKFENKRIDNNNKNNEDNEVNNNDNRHVGK